MDLLGYLGQEAGNQNEAHRESMLGTQRRDAQALLLAGLSSSLNRPGALSLCVRYDCRQLCGDFLLADRRIGFAFLSNRTTIGYLEQTKEPGAQAGLFRLKI